MDTRALRVKLFCDSADLQEMRVMKAAGLVSGFTSNPSLARRAGVTDYLTFAREAAAVADPCPMSLEVVADTPHEIKRQARLLARLGDNVVVKVPVVDTVGRSNQSVISELANEGIALNVTACFTEAHVRHAHAALTRGTRRSYISIFAGRIADVGQCPERLVGNAAWYVAGSNVEIIWASVREPYNVVQAERCGCQVITVFPEVLKRLERFGKDLDEFARETSQMFFQDATASGFML